jgi:hypothetical protein
MIEVIGPSNPTPTPTPIPTPRAILLLSCASQVLSEGLDTAVVEALDVVDFVAVERFEDVRGATCVGDGLGVAAVEGFGKVEKIVEFPTVSIVGGVFCHRT